VEEIVKKALLFVCVFAFCNLTLLAQTGKEPRFGHIAEKSAVHVAPKAGSSGWQTIYSNLGPSPTALYNNTDYWYVDSFQLPAMAFVPAANAHVTEVQLAIQLLTGGKAVYIWIAADSGGYPGNLLEGPMLVTKMPAAGTCCDLTVADFLPLQVYGGQRYWVVASAPFAGSASNFRGAWNFAYQGTNSPVSFNHGPGWMNQPSLQQPGGAVLGTWDPTAVGCQ
jgi:hypothetical protein